MSYCRFSNGDVYMYPHSGGFIECCTCLLAPTEKSNMGGLAKMMGLSADTHPELYEDYDMPTSLQFNTRSEALAHLEEHKIHGHIVPEYAVERIKKELAENGEYIPFGHEDGVTPIDVGFKKKDK